MYTVLLVDDEEKILEVMKVRIGWQELGVDKLLTASDGQAALEYFEQQRIDLLVTDIRMPRMDGLELIEKVRSLYPDTHCILLTAYGEFEYARRAIQLGVENYLLKPVADVEMEQTIQKALDNIYNRRKNSRDLLRENTLNRWASGSIGSEELSERAAVLGINLYQPEYCVVCAVRRGKSSLAAFRASCLELLAQKYEVNGFWDEKGRWVMILGGRDLSRENVSAEISHAAQESNAVDVLQPLIENYFAHGFDPSRQDSILQFRGYIRDEDTYVLTVEDNGFGMEEDALQALNAHLQEPIATEQESYGLKNLHQRIQLYYGPKCGLVIRKNPTGGLIAELCVLRKKPEEDTE